MPGRYRGRPPCPSPGRYVARVEASGFFERGLDLPGQCRNGVGGYTQTVSKQGGLEIPGQCRGRRLSSRASPSPQPATATLSSVNRNLILSQPQFYLSTVTLSSMNSNLIRHRPLASQASPSLRPTNTKVDNRTLKWTNLPKVASPPLKCFMPEH